jgi:hypothetical protein
MPDAHQNLEQKVNQHGRYNDGYDAEGEAGFDRVISVFYQHVTRVFLYKQYRAEYRGSQEHDPGQ